MQVVFLCKLGLKCFKSKYVNFWKIENLFWNTLYSGITKQLQHFFSNFSELTLSSIQINTPYFQLPIASKQLTVH